MEIAAPDFAKNYGKPIGHLMLVSQMKVLYYDELALLIPRLPSPTDIR